MNKHIELLTELLAQHCNKILSTNHWEHLSLNERQEYIRFYINSYLNEL